MNSRIFLTSSAFCAAFLLGSIVLSACDSAKPAETASPAAPAGATSATTAPTNTGVVNKSSAAKVREEDRKIDGP